MRERKDTEAWRAPHWLAARAFSRCGGAGFTTR